jgi:peptidoglycan/xylan/chitin deacetylase (PgdA/CDA1 family)
MIPILMYHQIAEVPEELDPHGLSVSPARFDEHMAYLAQAGYRCLPLPEAVQLFRGGGRAPAKSFVLTFDDGYLDFQTTAFPILAKYGFSATVFLVVGQLGEPSSWGEQDGARASRLLTPALVLDLARRGVVFGSHTVRHPRLSRLDDQEAFQEIRDSKHQLESLLGASVDFFAYPYSDKTERTEALVEQAGYAAACGGVMGAWTLFNLWRAPCGRDDTQRSLLWKAGGWYHRMIIFRESLAGRSLRRGFRGIRMLSRVMGIYRPSTFANRQHAASVEAMSIEND